LSSGLNASVAYALGINEEDINRIAGHRTVSSSQSGITAGPAKSRRVGSAR
jgi:hypothetical protein